MLLAFGSPSVHSGADDLPVVVSGSAAEVAQLTEGLESQSRTVDANFWAMAGQLLPLGAGGAVIRSIAYFSGNGMAQALTVLSCWTALGLALVAIAAGRTHRTAH